MRELEKRDYQERIIGKTVKAFLEDDYRSILIESPTGSGKTVVALCALKKMKEARPDLSFGWVAMRRKLLAQARQENERIGVEDIQFISMFEKNPPKCDVIVTDEAQHDSAATCADLHKIMQAKYSLGLTATPFRTDRVKLAYEKIIRDCGVRFLIEEGYLAPFSQYIIPEWSPEEIAKQLIATPEQWGKSVVYFKNSDLCWELQSRLQEGGVTSAVMLGSHSMERRESTFDGFDDGRIQVLINVHLLTEGFDSPDLRTVWVRDSVKLPTMQMAGRSLRKDPNNPDKVAQIVQSDKTIWPYPKCVNVKPDKQFIWREEEWRSLDPSERVEEMMRSVQQMIMSKPRILPQYLTNAGMRIAYLRINSDGEIKTNKSTSKTSSLLTLEDAMEEDE